MTTNDKLADALYQAAATAVCEARNTWNAHHEENWLEDGDALHPDAFIGRAVVDAVHPILAASLAAPPAQGEWQPIETAPRDGTRVLLSWDGTRVGYYLDNSTSPRPWKGWQVPSLEPWPKGQPIAWMPMPAPAPAAPQPAPAPVQVYVLGELADESEATYPNADASNLRAFGAQPPAPGERGAQTADDCWRYSPSVPLNPTQNALSILYDLGHDEGRYPEDHHAGKWAQVEAAYAAIAALAQQRVTDAVIRDALSDFRLQHWGDEDGGLGLADALSQLYGDDDIGRASEELDRLADAIYDALATIDQQQEARK